MEKRKRPITADGQMRAEEAACPKPNACRARKSSMNLSSKEILQGRGTRGTF